MFRRFFVSQMRVEGVKERPLWKDEEIVWDFAQILQHPGNDSRQTILKAYQQCMQHYIR
jgi:hypothetical protein